MRETLDQLKEIALDYLNRAISLGEELNSWLQADEPLQQLILAFLAGAIIGWFTKSFLSSRQGKKIVRSSGKAGSFHTEGAKSKEEVELNARRRL